MLFYLHHLLNVLHYKYTLYITYLHFHEISQNPLWNKKNNNILEYILKIKTYGYNDKLVAFLKTRKLYTLLIIILEELIEII